jgi:flagellar hook-associated protein 1 FlgK
VLSTQRDVNITPTTISTDGLNALGLQAGTFAAENPNFTIQIGTSDPVTIYLEPTDTINDLVTKLEWNPATQTGIPGLFVEINADGGLTLRPGIDDQNGGTVYGGDITINSGAFTSDPLMATNPAIIALPSGVNVVSALFGSFTVNGATVTNTSPITDFAYESEIINGSANFTNFRNNYLGPGGNISTDIFSAYDLIDYAQKLVNSTSSDLAVVNSSFENENTLREIIQRDFSDLSGVNIDEEMSNLIIVQTAYAAAARTITALDDMFQELLNAFRR